MVSQTPGKGSIYQTFRVGFNTQPCLTVFVTVKTFIHFDSVQAYHHVFDAHCCDLGGMISSPSRLTVPNVL